MTVSYNATVPSLVILNGGTVSNVIPPQSDAVFISLAGLASNAAGTYGIDVSIDGITFYSLSDSGGDIIPPNAGKLRNYVDLVSFYFRIRASAAVTADQTWKASKQWTD